MEIEISKTVTVKETINVDFPYYFKEDLSGDDYELVRYGKIYNGIIFTVSQNKKYDGDLVYGLEIEKVDLSNLSSYYFKKELRGNNCDFENALVEMLSEVNAIEHHDVIKNAGYSSVTKLIKDIDTHKRKYNEIVRHRSEALVFRADGFSKIVDMPKKFEKMYPFSQHSIKNKSDAYIGFMMAVDYFTNQAFKK